MDIRRASMKGRARTWDQSRFASTGSAAASIVDNAPVATPTAVNPDSAYQVMVSETTIDGTIEDLLAGEHAVMIYESDEAMDAIACGNVGGALYGDTLVTGLAEAGVPGHIGFALFRSEGDQTDVLVDHWAWASAGLRIRRRSW